MLPHLQLEIIEAIGIRIETKNGNIDVFSVYFPNTTYSNAVFDSFRKDIKSLVNNRNSFFICGDLNAKHTHWNCRVANKCGKILFDEMNYSPYIIENPPTPTHFSYLGNPTTIDIMLTNNLHKYSQLAAHQDLSSDHLPVVFDVFIKDIPVSSPSKLNFRYDKANWKHFRDHLSENIDLIHYSDPENLSREILIDEAIQKLNDLMLAGQELAVPKEPSPIQQNELEFDDDLINLIKLRNTRRRQWQRTRQSYLKIIVSELNKKIGENIQTLRNKRWENSLQQITSLNNNQKLWRISKILRKKSNSIPTLRTQQSNGPAHQSFILTDEDKAEALVKQFSSVYENRPNTSDQATRLLVQSTNFSTLNDENTDIVKLTNPREISTLIRRLKNKKSPGFDTINNKLLKQIPKKALVLLTYIFNACLKISYFPKAWKHAKVIGIFKPGKDPFNPASYRPISLLSIFGKLFERIILKEIYKHLEAGEESLLPDVQFGFRNGHSTCHQLARLTKFIKQNLNNKKSTGMVLFDVEKAFDNVWFDGLIYKMKILNFNSNIIKLIHSFLMDRTFAVVVNGKMSSIKNVPAGVPQGAVMSPTLYNIFTYDLPTFVACDDLQISQFADDTAFYTSSEQPSEIINNLEASLLKLNQYCVKWNIKLNADKTQSIFFTRRRAERYLPERKLKFNGIEIDWANEVKYLGLHLDKKLLFNVHIERSIEKNQKIFRMLYSILNRKSKMAIEHKMLIYKSILLPALMYGSPIWSQCAATHTKKVQVNQNKCLKTIHNLPWRFHTDELHILAKTKLIEEFIEEYKINFESSCEHSSNLLINQLLL